MTTTATVTELRVKTGVASDVIRIESGATIGQLKQKLFELTKIPVNSQSLVSFGFKDDDDSRTVSKVFRNKTLLHVNTTQAKSGSSKEEENGHMYEDTTANNSDLQQGYQVDERFRGQDPENRANNKYKHTDVTDGTLKQGDHYKSKKSGSLAKDNVQQSGGQQASSDDHHQQGKAYLEEQHHGSNSPVTKNSGGQYLNTSATKTDQHQGDKIYSHSSLCVPRGAKGGTYKDTKSQGGTLHQGNTFGSE